MKHRFNRVAVLLGGGSSEREISLLSGAAVAGALREAGYDAVETEVSRENRFTLPEGTEAVFIMLHGAYGEDGGVQSELDRLGVPYTGSNAAVSRVCFDKQLSREAFAAAGVPVAPGYLLRADVVAGGVVPPPALALPVVVKATRQGSSVGVYIVHTPKEWAAAVRDVFRYGDAAVVETFIPGREWSVPVIGEDTVLPGMEMIPSAARGWYDFTAKYSDDAGTVYAFPEDNPADAALVARSREIALQAYRAVGARGMGRIDMRITPEGEIFVLEINNIPGCTHHSILPQAGRKAGIAFPELCSRILESAACG